MIIFVDVDINEIPGLPWFLSTETIFLSCLRLGEEFRFDQGDLNICQIRFGHHFFGSILSNRKLYWPIWTTVLKKRF